MGPMGSWAIPWTYGIVHVVLILDVGIIDVGIIYVGIIDVGITLICVGIISEMLL